MPNFIASIAFAAFIAGLFLLDRDKRNPVSKALWIPTAWLFISASRPVSQWLGISTAMDAASVYLEGSPMDRSFFAILEAVALIVLIHRRRQVRLILRRNWPIGLFFLYAAVSMSWSDYPFVTFKHWIKGIGDVMMVLIVLTEPRVGDAVRRIVTRIGFIHIPLSILFIKYYPMLGRRLTNSWTMEAVGVATQKNGLGILCDIFGLGLLWRFLSAYNDPEGPERSRQLLALGTVLAMIVWLLWQCKSMTSICALTMAGGVMSLSMRPAFRRRPALVRLLVLAVPACSLYTLFFQPSAALIEGLGKDPTLTGRTMNWPIILGISNNRLIGTGYESFWLGPRLLTLWDQFPNFPINEAHNGYIEILINMGWIGVALLGILIATGFRNVIAAYRRDPETGSLRIAFFLATVVTAFTEAAFRMMGSPWIAFLMATAAAPWVQPRSVAATAVAIRNQNPDLMHDRQALTRLRIGERIVWAG